MMKFPIVAAAALLLAMAGASAQTEAPPPPAPPPAPAPAGQAAPANAAEAAAEQALDPGIEVSLGRSEIKQQVAQAMGLTTVDVPLTVRAPLEVARQVCGETVFESTADTNRSCTATRFAPELVEAARASLQSEADELTGAVPPPQ